MLQRRQAREIQSYTAQLRLPAPSMMEKRSHVPSAGGHHRA